MKKIILFGLIFLIMPIAFAGVDIVPNNPYTNDDLNCVVNLNVTDYLVKWFVDGGDSGIENILVNHTQTAKNQEWECRVRKFYPFVGYVPLGSDSVVINNSVPVLAAIPAITASETDIINITPTAIDADRDALTYSINDTRFSYNSGVFLWLTDYDDEGSYQFKITASDDENAEDSEIIAVTVLNTNRLPTITGIIAPASVNELELLNVSFTAADLDSGDVLSYQILKNGTVVSTTNSFSWQTGYFDAGTYNFTFIVNDGRGGSASDSRTVIVNNVNRAPNITSVTAPASVNEGGLLGVSFIANDPDNDVLSYQILRNSIVVSNSSSFSWLTTYDDAGEHNFTFIVNDGNGGSDTELRTIVVNNTDRAPNITLVTAPASINESQLLNVSFTAEDLDGDALSYQILRNDVVVSNTSSFSWLTNYSDAGIYEFVFIASVGSLQDNETRIIAVNNVNRAPNITLVTGTASPVVEGSTIALYFEAVDLDGEVISYQILRNDVVVSTTNIFNWNTTPADVGTYNLTFIASDGALQDAEYATINVVFAATGNVVINEFMANPSSGADWVEIYNNNSVTIGIGGWTLLDTTGVMHTVAGGTTLASGAFYVANVSNRLNNGGDTIFLNDSALNRVDIYTYSSSEAGVSVGRFPDGANDWYSLTVATPGAANIYGSLVIDSWINETFYSGSGYYNNINGIVDSTINISNITGATIDISISDIFNSVIIDSTIIISELDDSDITSSIINNSILTNCVVVNSIVKNYIGSDCVIIDSTVDPPTPGNNLTGSNITGNSNIYNSNVTYSNIDNCNINDSNINHAEIYNTTISDSVIENSTIYNAVVDGANISDGILWSGDLTYNGILYNQTTNLTDIINYYPVASFTVSSNSITVGSSVTFDASASYDINEGGELNDVLNYSWKFEDGAEETTNSTTTSHTYNSAGSYTATLTVTDSFNLTDSESTTITVNSAPSGDGGSPSGGGNGGGSGGSTGFIGRTIDLSKGAVEITLKKIEEARFLFDNELHYIRVKDIEFDSAEMVVASTVRLFDIKTGSEFEVDLNNDGRKDLKVKLAGTKVYTQSSQSTATLRIELIKEKEEVVVEKKEEPAKKEAEVPKEAEVKKETAEEGWADYTPEPPSITGWAVGVFKNKVVNIPYIKYVAAGIILLVIVIIVLKYGIEQEKPKRKQGRRKKR